jgi:hypothetical protein
MIKVLLKRILHPFFPFKSRKRKQRPDREELLSSLCGEEIS